MPTGFALSFLALVLASCGSVSQPPPVAALPEAAAPGDVALVPLKVSASGAVKAQGITGPSSRLHFDVRVRNGQGRPVTFNGTTYDPGGKGSPLLVLNSANLFQQTLLLPAGEYTFENAVMDDDTGRVLVGYGPAGENRGTVSGDGGAIRLKFHAVFDRASSALAPSLPLDRLFTDATFNLALNARSGNNAALPTSDLGQVQYALGNVTDGVLNNAGSKIGVNVTARGSATDRTLNVTARFDAWTRDGQADTASYGPVMLEYAQDIEVSGLKGDITVPELTFARVQGAVQGVMTRLSGTVTDDVQVVAGRLYDNGALVASTAPDERAPGFNTDVAGNWSVDWRPATGGSHQLTVVVSDSSGNESRSGQTVEVARAPAQPVADLVLAEGGQGVEYDLKSGVARTFNVVVPAEALGNQVYFAVGSGTCVDQQDFQDCYFDAPRQFTMSVVGVQGQAVPPPDLDHENFSAVNDLAPGAYQVTVIPTADIHLLLYGGFW